MEARGLKVAVIGGGAAGFFSAISVKTNYPEAEVILFEKSQNLLSKVKVSGGGRCNVTNACESISELSNAYPRGGKWLKQAFKDFNNRTTVEWFETKGVRLVAEADLRVFPATNKSQTIIDCFMHEVQRLGIILKTGMAVKSIHPKENGIELIFESSPNQVFSFSKVIVASGGSPKRTGFEWLEILGHKIEEPVPSLFTFNMPGNAVTGLMGVSVTNAKVSIQGTNLNSTGPLLITHWGMSGPAILKLSAFGARNLAHMDYHFIASVNWTGSKNYEQVITQLQRNTKEHPMKSISNTKEFELPGRLWNFLLEKAGINPEQPWLSLSKKSFNKFSNILTNDEYEVKGKTTFKEEFVTCGGVSLESINPHTMQSKVCNGLYFGGEIMDIDGITGGFNFQAAWTTGFIAGKLG